MIISKRLQRYFRLLSKPRLKNIKTNKITNSTFNGVKNSNTNKIGNNTTSTNRKTKY